jgi:hypothetical protein
MVNHFVPAPPATAGAHQRTAAQQQQPFIHPRDREFMAQTENAPPNQETVPGGRCAKWHFVISNSILLVCFLALSMPMYSTVFMIEFFSGFVSGVLGVLPVHHAPNHRSRHDRAVSARFACSISQVRRRRQYRYV